MTPKLLTDGYRVALGAERATEAVSTHGYQPKTATGQPAAQLPEPPPKGTVSSVVRPKE